MEEGDRDIPALRMGVRLLVAYGRQNYGWLKMNTKKVSIFCHPSFCHQKRFKGVALFSTIRFTAIQSQFVVDGLEVGDLGSVLEVFPDTGGGVLAQNLPECGIGGEPVEVIQKAVAVALFHQQAVLIIGDGFRDASMVGGEDRQAGGHGFEHGVRDAFLILVWRSLAGMEKSVGTVIEAAEGRSVEEAGKGYFSSYSQLQGKLLEFREEGAITSDSKVAFWKGFAEQGKGGEREGEAFFFDQAAGLDEPPFAIGREDALLSHREGVHGDTGAVHPDFSRRAAEIQQAILQGMGTGEDEGDGLEEGAQSIHVARLTGPGHNIRPMKGDEGRQGAVVLQKWQEMDARVAEVNVEQVRLTALEDTKQGAVFPAVNERGLAANVFEVKSPEEVGFWRRDDLDIREGKGGSRLPFLCQDKGAMALQSGDLPVDVQHFRFQEGGAVAGDAHGQRWQMEVSTGTPKALASGNKKAPADRSFNKLDDA